MVLFYKVTLLIATLKWHLIVTVILVSWGVGLSPIWHQAITLTKADWLTIRPSCIHLDWILFKIQTFSLKKMHLKLLFAKCRPFLFRPEYVNAMCWSNQTLTHETNLRQLFLFFSQMIEERWVEFVFLHLIIVILSNCSKYGIALTIVDFCDSSVTFYAGIILWMRSDNERRCYIVTSSLIGWAHTQNDPCSWHREGLMS